MTRGKFMKNAGGCCAAAPAPSQALSMSRETTKKKPVPKAMGMVRSAKIQTGDTSLLDDTDRLDKEIDKFVEDMAKEPPKPRIAMAAQVAGAGANNPSAQAIACAKAQEKEIFFYESSAMMTRGIEAMRVHRPDVYSQVQKTHGLCWGWAETEQAMGDGVPFIITSQMGLLSTRLFEKGYAIFVYPAQGKSYEIRLGSNNCTDKEIRLAHNLFKMWTAGAFSAN